MRRISCRLIRPFYPIFGRKEALRKDLAESTTVYYVSFYWMENANFVVVYFKEKNVSTFKDAFF